MFPYPPSAPREGPNGHIALFGMRPCFNDDKVEDVQTTQVGIHDGHASLHVNPYSLVRFRNVMLCVVCVCMCVCLLHQQIEQWFYGECVLRV